MEQQIVACTHPALQKTTGKPNSNHLQTVPACATARGCDARPTCGRGLCGGRSIELLLRVRLRPVLGVRPPWGWADGLVWLGTRCGGRCASSSCGIWPQSQRGHPVCIAQSQPRLQMQ